MASVAASAASLTGTVRDAVTGSALSGMVVAVYDRNGDGSAVAAATTDSKGKYSLQLAAGRQYGAVAYDPNFVYAVSFQNNAPSFEESPVLTPGPTETITVDFQLQAGGTLSGQVKVSGAPANNVTVAAYNLSGSRRATTQVSNGTYAFLLPPGSYKLVAWSNNAGIYGTQFFRGQNTFFEATPVVVTARGGTGSIDFDLSLAAQLTGTVVDARTNSVLAGMIVYAYSPGGYEVASTTTDTAGRFTLAVATGSYRLVVADPASNYAKTFLVNAASFDTAATYALGPGETRAVVAALPRAGRIAGRLTDATTGGGVTGTVIAYNADGTTRGDTRTDTTGAYSIALPPGDYKLVAYDDNSVYAPQFYRNAAAFSASTTVKVIESQTTPSIDFALPRAGRFTGTTRSASSGAALSGITVAAYAEDGSLAATATSSAAGTYSLAVNPGNYRLVAFDPAHVYATTFAGSATFEGSPPRSIAAGWTDMIDFSLQPGVRVTGTITNSSLLPLAGVEVSALNMQGQHAGSAFTDSNGSFELVVPAGSYKFYARDPAGRFHPTYFDNAASLASAATVNVTGPATQPLRFVLLSTARRRSVAH